MMLFPAATDTPAASVMVMLALLLAVFVPTFLTKAMPARASDAARLNSAASASVAVARRTHFPGERTVIASEVGDRRVIRVIVSPLRMANAGRPPSANLRHTVKDGMAPHGAEPMCKRRAVVTPPD